MHPRQHERVHPSAHLHTNTGKHTPLEPPLPQESPFLTNIHNTHTHENIFKLCPRLLLGGQMKRGGGAEQERVRQRHRENVETME